MKHTIELPNKLTLEAQILNNVLKYKVTNQSNDFTAALKRAKVIEDGPYSLKYNRRPAFCTEKERFYLRGSDPEQDNREVRIEFETSEEAIAALVSLQKMIAKVSPESYTPDHPGSTTAARMALIKRSQAQTLGLTAKDHYPDERSWTPAQPHVLDCNFHFTEHIGQLIDVLNKSVEPQGTQTAADIVNPHKVDKEAAEWAVDAIRNLFDLAEEQGGKHLVALWRIVSGTRAPDVDENGDGRQRNPTPPND